MLLDLPMRWIKSSTTYYSWHSFDVGYIGLFYIIVRIYINIAK